MKYVIDCATNQETVREMTAEEIAIETAEAETYAKKMAEQSAIEAAKAAAQASATSKLEAIGLTAEEIAALRG